ncbi:MAG: hypothetical protein IBX64_11870 [Actinobacteria bacterium]|nr:hypothetical protein [Actinomycetota bacterium]
MSTKPEDRPKFDPETGEVLESPDATLSINGGPEIPLKDFEVATKRLEQAQLTLFEGHKINMVEQKLKAAAVGMEAVSTDSKPPRLYETKYFMVKAKVLKVEHAEKDGLLIKTVTFEASATKEIDQFTGERIIAGM